MGTDPPRWMIAEVLDKKVGFETFYSSYTTAGARPNSVPFSLPCSAYSSPLTSPTHIRARAPRHLPAVAQRAEAGGYAFNAMDANALHLYNLAVARAAALCEDKAHVVAEVLALLVAGGDDEQVQSILGKDIIKSALEEARKLCRRSLGRSIVHYHLRSKDETKVSAGLEAILSLRDRCVPFTFHLLSFSCFSAMPSPHPSHTHILYTSLLTKIVPTALQHWKFRRVRWISRIRKRQLYCCGDPHFYTSTMKG